jgi:hypothetical protein
MDKDVEWIQVGALADELSENVLPDSADLAGKTIRLFFENGTINCITFNDIHSLTWKVVEGDGKGSEDDEAYIATCPRQNIYFVDYIKHCDGATKISLVLDLESGIATAVIGTLPTEEEARTDPFRRAQSGMNLTAVDARFLSATIDREFGADEERHEPTTELVGKRVKYLYSEKDTYEHIYLNEKLFTWHCLAGIEKGLADTELCHHLKVADELYLFVWREKLIPTLGVVLVDFRKMKTTGMLFGYESHDFGKLTNVRIGAYAELMNVTRYG